MGDPKITPYKRIIRSREQGEARGVGLETSVPTFQSVAPSSRIDLEKTPGYKANDKKVDLYPYKASGKPSGYFV